MPESLDYVVTPLESPSGATLEGGGSETWAILGIGELGFMILGSGIPWGAVDDDGDAWPIEPGQLDPAATARARIWKQFEGTTSWPLLVGSTYGRAWQDVEEVLQDLRRRRYVSTADGVWLEEIGANVGRARGGQTDDDDYRIAIVAEALSQVTDGSPDELIDLAIRLAPDSDVIYSEPAPATFVLTVTELDGVTFDLLRDVMGDMPPVGVGAWLDTYDPALAGGPGWDTVDATMGAPGWEPQPAGVLATHGWGGEIG